LTELTNKTLQTGSEGHWYCWISPSHLESLPHVKICIGLYSMAWYIKPLHQQNEFSSLQASRCVWEDVECKLICVNFRRVSDRRRVFLLAFRVTGSTDDKPGSTWECWCQVRECVRQVCECRRQARECQPQDLEHRPQTCEHVKLLLCSLGKSSSLGMLLVCLEIYSYYLSFNDC
jgi:hypothetical protein